MRRRLDRDLAASALGGLTFSMALGMASVALPLLALHAGYSKSAVGLLTAASAPAMLIAGLLITLPALTTRKLAPHTPEPIGSTARGGAP